MKPFFLKADRNKQPTSTPIAPDFTINVVLAANTRQTVQVPTAAIDGFVLFSADGPFWARANGPAYIPSSTLTDVTASDTTDKITETGHSRNNGDGIVISSGTPPTGLITGVTYFVRDSATNDYKLAATSGGVAIDLTSAGADIKINRSTTDGSGAVYQPSSWALDDVTYINFQAESETKLSLSFFTK